MVTIESLSAGVPTFVNNNMGSCEFLIKLLPNNKFNLKMKKDSLLLKLNSINQKNLNTQSNHLKNNFKKVYKNFSKLNYDNLDNILKH